MGLTCVGKKYLMLVVGGYDSKIHCYTCKRWTEGQEVDATHHFTYKFSLGGHMDSIKDFAFTWPDLEFASGLQYLASGSQDKNIRIWKL